MAKIDLSQDEITILLQTLEGYLSDLSMEISNTDSMDFREHLKENRHTLQSVIDKLEASAQAEGKSQRGQAPALSGDTL